MKKLFSLFSPKYPPLHRLSQQDIPSGLLLQYSDKVYLTPRYQKITYSQDFLKYVRYLQRKSTINYQDLRKLAQNIVAQYQSLMLVDRQNFNIQIYKNVQIPRSPDWPYQGVVDWYYSVNGFNSTPILFFEQNLNPIPGIALALSNMYRRSEQKKIMQQTLKKDQKIYNHANSTNNQNIHGYSIITTGNEWQLIRIDKNYLLQKSVILQGRNQFRSIIHDQEMMTVILGMLDYCLDIPHENVRALEKSYQYLEQRRWMNESTEPDQQETYSKLSEIFRNYYRKKL